MGLGVEHVLVEADQVGRREDEVEVLERLGNPEALEPKISMVTKRKATGGKEVVGSPPCSRPAAVSV
jgi:hypothetical protein